MDWRKFEDVCRRSGAAPVEKFTYDDVDVFIADGQGMHPDTNIMCYRTVVALGNMKGAAGDDMGIAQPLYFSKTDVDNMVLSARLEKARDQGRFLVDALKKAREPSGEEAEETSYH